MDLNILIGGEAGQGLKTTATILGKSLFRMGYNIYTTKDYMSRIRGGHNFIKIRVGDQDLTGPAAEIDILVGLNQETVDLHKQEMTGQGVIISEEEQEASCTTLTLPATEIAREINPRGVNTVFAGSVLKLLDLETDSVEQVIREYFGDEDKSADNLKLLEKGYQAVDSVFELPAVDGREHLYINGNDAVGLGAVVGGVSYYTAYPMSPSTGILNYMAGKQEEKGIAVEQAEDEIAAINMALGASYGGVRAMTGTSGGGLALMAEGVGLAGITETPVVIAEVQRPGPATGLPTRTEQGDLQFAINISQGEFPLIITAPRDQQDAFYQAFRALNLADKYQIPVILLSDQFLADSSTNIPRPDLDELEIKRHLVSERDYQDSEYRRYQLTADGVSPRAYPGQLPGETVLVDSDEHDEQGHIIEDAATRKKMVDKRAAKETKFIEEDLTEPLYNGQDNPEYVLVGWGSTYGPLQEARQLLEDDGLEAGLLSFNDVWPLPRARLKELADKGCKLISVENNSTAQFARIIRSETGIKIEASLLKYDGRPFTGQEIYRRFKKEVID